MKTLGIIIMMAAAVCVSVIFVLEYWQHGFAGGWYTPPHTVEMGGLMVRFKASGILANYWPCLACAAVFVCGLVMFLKAPPQD